MLIFANSDRVRRSMRRSLVALRAFVLVPLFVVGLTVAHSDGEVEGIVLVVGEVGVLSEVGTKRLPEAL